MKRHRHHSRIAQGDGTISTDATEVAVDPTPSRRDELLRSAASLFAQYGVNGVSTNQIAAQLGLSGPALYRHFESKDAILSELLLRDSRRLRDTAGEIIRFLEPRPALTALVEAHVGFAIEHTDLIVIQSRELQHLQGPDRQTVQEIQREYIEIWAATLLRVRPEISLSTALSATVAVLGLINSAPFGLQRESGKKLGPLLQQMAITALLMSDIS
ncbi:TetR/AcrR family transcriptional regulator [Nocardia barduliensis]|uniref:TetR/AcrR family transcriptional regulator n=1 Tax=Nocardia barduliensis TaxID=2736643 RepID=UPI0024841195|nr:TetR/AcrR family transcriptional regulator [Nocardia barduliensis]